MRWRALILLLYLPSSSTSRLLRPPDLTDIYRSDPPRRRECLYYLSLGHFKLGNFDEARRFNAILLEREPSNLQAQSLAQLIDRGVSREGYIGMAITAGAAALGGVLIAGLMRRRR